MAKDKCIKGYSCGNTCIAKTKICQKGASLAAGEIISNFSKAATGKAAAKEPSDFRIDGKLLGKGFFGEAYLTKNDTVAKVQKVNFRKAEVEDLTKMGEAGFSPKLIGTGRLADGSYTMEMEYLDGYRTAHINDKGYVSMTPKQYRKVRDALSYMHTNGRAHYDLHGLNVLVDDSTNDAKLIDFGLARKLTYDSAMEDVYAYENYISGRWPDGTPQKNLLNTLDKGLTDEEKQSALNKYIRELRIESINADPNLTRAEREAKLNELKG